MDSAQAQVTSVTVGGKNYSVGYTRISYNSNPEFFNTPANGGVMPWWTNAPGDDAIALDFYSLLIDRFAGLGNATAVIDASGPIYAYSTNTINTAAPFLWGVSCFREQPSKCTTRGPSLYYENLYYAYTLNPILPGGNNTINLTSNLGIFLLPEFSGGTLKVDQSNQLISEVFYIGPVDSSEIDTNNAFTEFSGNFMGSDPNNTTLTFSNSSTLTNSTGTSKGHSCLIGQHAGVHRPIHRRQHRGHHLQGRFTNQDPAHQSGQCPLYAHP